MAIAHINGGSILVNQRHPDIVKALVLICVTGGDTAAKRLPPKYYGQFIKAAQEGGMRAVCQTEDYQARIRARPENEAILMAMVPATFIQVQTHWLNLFTKGPIYPVMGVDEATLRDINVPVFIIPGNDRTHASRNALDAAKLIPQSVVLQIPIEDQEVDIISSTDWAPYEAEISNQVIGF